MTFDRPTTLPPRWAESLLRMMLAPKDRDSVSGDLLEEFRLAHVADLLASELSWGQRKLLEFAALLMSEPRLVLLDEPTAGVNPILTETMETHIRSRNADGVTFFIGLVTVPHVMPMMHVLIERLGKTERHGLHHCKHPIERTPVEIRVVDEVV